MRPEAGAHLWDAAEEARLVDEFTQGKTEAEFNSEPRIRAATLGVPALIPVLNELVNEASGPAGA